MRKAITGFVLLGMLLLGCLVYFWGAGAFWPCEPGGRMLNGDRCAFLMRDNVGSAAKLPNGNLLVAVSAPEDAENNAIKLVEIPAAGGAVLNETVLRSTPIQAFAGDIAVSPDGQQVALEQTFREGRRRSQLTVFDRTGNVVAEDLGGGPGYMAFDARGRLLLHPGAIIGEAVSAGLAEAYDLSVSTVPQLVNWNELGTMFQKGLTIAYSPDGELFAQAMNQMGGTPFVGIRVGTVGLEDRPGMLLGASIRSGCGYNFSDVAFSPSSQRIVAVFDCPDDWGKVSSTMEVWDYELEKHLLTVPVLDGFSDPFWYDDNTIIARRYSYDAHSTDLFSIKVPEPRRY